MTEARFRWLGAAVLTLGFLWFIAPGVSARFTPDDVMNLYLAWLPPWQDLLLQIALPWRPGLRPIGGALYRASFETFGFNLFALRCFLIALVALNTWLTARLADRLSGSSWAGWFCASFALYHVNFQALYWNTGACYDILAFTGVWSAALIALRARTETVRAPLWFAAAVLFWLALGSKEIALALPAILLAFELLPGQRQWLAILASGALSAAFIFGRVYGAGGILSTAAYRPEFTPAAYARSLSVMLADLTYRPGGVVPEVGVLVVIGLAALAALARSRAACTAWLCFVLAALPIALVPPRGAYAWYLPLAALWMLLGILFARLQRHRPAIWIIVTAALFFVHSRQAHRVPGFILAEQQAIARVIEALPRSDLRSAPGEHFLLVDDPFQGQQWGEWKSAMLIQLHLRRRDLLVFYPHQRDQPAGLIPLGWRNESFQREPAR